MAVDGMLQDRIDGPVCFSQIWVLVDDEGDALLCGQREHRFQCGFKAAVYGRCLERL